MAQSAPAGGGAAIPSDPNWLLPTSKLNAQLPFWLRFSGEERLRPEGAEGQNFDSMGDGYLLNRFRFNMDLLPTNWLSFHFQVQDADAFAKNAPAPPFQDTWDLRLAYVQVGETESDGIAIRVGRQELAFGDQRLIGISDWTNVARSFDAARLTLREGKFSVDAFAASAVVLQDGQVGDHQAGNTLDGVYGEMRDVVPNSTIQPYFLWHRAPLQKMGNGTVAAEDFGTSGVRWAGKLPAGWDYGTEMAWQRGSLGSDGVSAWGGHWGIGYTVPSAKLKHLRYMAEYNFASGDSSSTDKVRGTFDQLYPSGHDKIELADQVGWRNIEHLRTGPEVPLTPKLKVSFKYSDMWLANSHDALYNASGNPIVTRLNGSAGRWVGQEFDGTAVYALTKVSQIGAGYGYLLPGTFLQTATPGHAYSYPYLFYNTKF
jgi:hypothetical protein